MLQPFQLNICYIARFKNKVADLLSRPRRIFSRDMELKDKVEIDTVSRNDYVTTMIQHESTGGSEVDNGTDDKTHEIMDKKIFVFYNNVLNDNVGRSFTTDHLIEAQSQDSQLKDDNFKVKYHIEC